MKPSHPLGLDPKDLSRFEMGRINPRLTTNNVSNWCLLKEITESFLEPLVFLLKENLLGDVHKHAAGVLARRIRPAPPPDPQRPAVVLAPEFEDHSLFVGSGCQQRKRIAQSALSLLGIGKKGGSEEPLDFLGLDPKGFHRRVVGLENARIDCMMYISDGCF